jgi:hypothetical protein
MKQAILAVIILIAVVGLGFALSSYKVSDTKLDEVSGIAASRLNKDLYYVHNDSGGKSEIYVLNKKGKTVCTISLPGITNRDWEDIAVGPGPKRGANYIYIGEIGDNGAQHKNVCLYRFREPVLDIKSGKKLKPVTVTAVDSLGFVFADGAKDCETVMLDPVKGDVYLVSKREATVGVYQIKAPLDPKNLNTATRLLSLDFPLAVSGDISPQGDKVLIKTYGTIYCWLVNPGQSIAEALSRPATKLTYEPEPQGEAVCFSSNGKRYLTISEKAKDTPLFLNSYKLRKILAK